MSVEVLNKSKLPLIPEQESDLLDVKKFMFFGKTEICPNDKRK